MAETVFQKPLDAQVASNTNAITNIDDLLYKLSYGGESVTATVTVKNGTSSSIDSSLRVSYTDNYIIVKGVVRLRGFTRTGSNPGITVTIPSGITVGTTRTAYGISSSLNPSEYLTLQMSAGVNSFTITTSESVANAVNGTWVITVPPIILRR